MNKVGFVWAEIGLGETGVSVLSRDPSTVARVRCRSLATSLLYRMRPDLGGESGHFVSKPGIGQPVFQPPVDAVCLSLTHSEVEGRWICAAAVAVGCRVGIDVEGERRVFSMPRFQERYLSDSERAEVTRAASPVRAVQRLWVAKEAIGKALGSGIQAGFSEIDCPALMRSNHSRISYEGHGFTVHVFEHSEWALGLAFDAEADICEYAASELNSAEAGEAPSAQV